MAQTTAIETIDRSAPGPLRSEWEELADELRASPFLHPGFVLTWARAFGPARLSVVTARSGGRLVGLLPLVPRGGAMVSPANWHTPEAGPLAVDDQAQQAVVMALLAAHPRRISLAFLDGAAATTGRLRQTLVRAEYRIVERQLTSAPYVALEGDWDAFHQRLPRKLRNELRRRERRLADEGVVASEVSDGTADLDDRFAELLRLEALGWKGEGGTAIASRPDTRAFYRGVAEWAAARGWLRLPSVRLDDRPLAMRFGLEAHGVFYSMKVGFDPAFRAFGPGVMLLRDVIRRSYEAGLERVELLGTIDPHKQQWSTGVRERIALQTFSPAPAGRVDHLLYARAMPLAKRLGAGRLRAVLPGRGGLRI